MTGASYTGRDDVAEADAPGRVNLMGDHTDYNGGYVLPLAIPQRTRVRVQPRPGTRLVRVHSANVAPEEADQTYVLGDERPGRGWLDYVQGVTWALREAGYRVEGFDADVVSNVPVGSGVASSAALEVSLLRALRVACELRLDDVRLALLGQRAETGLVGAQVLVPPPQASAHAGAGLK